jgi:hypothetical protein
VFQVSQECRENLEKKGPLELSVLKENQELPAQRVFQGFRENEDCLDYQ